MKMIPYLSFDGLAEEVMNFYADVFGGEVTQLDRYSSVQGMPVPEGYADKVLHGRVQIGESFLYFSDAQRPVVAGDMISLAPDFASEDKIDRAFDLLSRGGQVHMELQKTFWGAKYGKLTDKYGVNWDLNYQYPAE
ncbi:VOC family protein [Tumebacillus permanentifrigoris]|uniref:PhnB protein n=1 Tax=Tumebacillus permanentifrigoris TaxID=378543 RepID=A0A316D641_9BACL|nr:VOC family protein [Tumebacillus permanentifrigoris]PWK09653.1 PhnB protein [Tumebacillus permanentifrigoris]